MSKYRGRRKLISLCAGLPYPRKLTGLDATVTAKDNIRARFPKLPCYGILSPLTMDLIYWSKIGCCTPRSVRLFTLRFFRAPSQIECQVRFSNDLSDRWEVAVDHRTRRLRMLLLKETSLFMYVTAYELPIYSRHQPRPSNIGFLVG